MTMLLTVLGLSLLILLHELGHYLMARACRMRVLRFSIGFGPSLLEQRVGETIWQIAAIPLGGFVQIDGMGAADPEQAAGAPPAEGTFRSRPLWQRIAVIFAGPAMNWLLAALLVAGLAGTVGLERHDDATLVIGEVMEGLPAHQAGLRPGDRVMAVDGDPVGSWSELVRRLQARPEEPVQLTIQRPAAAGEAGRDTARPATGQAAPSQRVELTVTPKLESGVGRIGVTPQVELVRLAPGAAVTTGFAWAAATSAQQASLLWGMLVGREEGKLSGLPGIVSELSSQAARGLHRLVQSLAWLSITLFLLNLAPIPALDGGRLVFLGLETVRGKPIDERIEGLVHGVGFILLIGLMIFVSIRDLVG